MGVRLGRSSRYDRNGKVRVGSKLQCNDFAGLDDARQGLIGDGRGISKVREVSTHRDCEFIMPETLICHH